MLLKNPARKFCIEEVRKKMTSGVGVKIEQRINFRVFFGKNSKNLDLKTLNRKTFNLFLKLQSQKLITVFNPLPLLIYNLILKH